VRRFASLGVALALAVGTLVPIAHAQTSGKTLVLGFTQEPDTFVAGEGNEYVTQVVDNLVYSQLVVIDDQMRPIADLAVDVPTLDNGDAVMVGDGADMPVGTKMEGLTYRGGLSRYTTTMLARVNGLPVMVFVDRANADTHPTLPSGESKLHLFRKELGPLVLYELTPLDQPKLSDYLYLAEVPPN